MRIAESELILNEDGSIYHLRIKPEDLCDTIITVGDPNRVKTVSQFFDTLDFQSENREIVIHKGKYHANECMVISTGMGTDNIDIILNELDALANIDFHSREVKTQLRSLSIIRIGTSGTIQEDIPLGSTLLTQNAIGIDGLLWSYENHNIRNAPFESALLKQIHWDTKAAKPYVITGSKTLLEKIQDESTLVGNTFTCNGFYGPQGRQLRLKLSSPHQMNELENFDFEGHKITNIEMETSGIYALSALLGHHAISVNLILANRKLGTFIDDYHQPMEKLIESILKKLFP